jgi:glycosyltransferase involved in cell wall biosynthesis
MSLDFQLKGDEPAQPDVTVVVTAHAEGTLLRMSVNALLRCRARAADSGIDAEILVVGDALDAATARVVDDLEGTPGVRILRENFRDLGLARNAGIHQARGRWVAVADGDDLYGANWLVASLDRAHREDSPCIVHPELVVLFGAESGHYWQRGEDSPDFDKACALHINPFNSCAFAERAVFLAHPYHAVGPAAGGFGFEDWHWNCETMAAGIRHLVASTTVQFVRRKSDGSLSKLQARHSAIIRPTSFFAAL